MGFKTGALVGFAIGYVKGSKAGRQRYEELKLKLDKLSHSPAVRKAIQPVQPLVDAKMEAGKEMFGSVMSRASGVKPENRAAVTPSSP